MWKKSSDVFKTALKKNKRKFAKHEINKGRVKNLRFVRTLMYSFFHITLSETPMLATIMQRCITFAIATSSFQMYPYNVFSFGTSSSLFNVFLAIKVVSEFIIMLVFIIELNCNMLLGLNKVMNRLLQMA